MLQEVGWYDEDRNSSGVLTSKLSADALSVKGQFGDSIGLLTHVRSGRGCLVQAGEPLAGSCTGMLACSVAPAQVACNPTHAAPSHLPAESCHPVCRLDQCVCQWLEADAGGGGVLAPHCNWAVLSHQDAGPVGIQGAFSSKECVLLPLASCFCSRTCLCTRLLGLLMSRTTTYLHMPPRPPLKRS